MIEFLSILGVVIFFLGSYFGGNYLLGTLHNSNLLDKLAGFIAGIFGWGCDSFYYSYMLFNIFRYF